METKDARNTQLQAWSSVTGLRVDLSGATTRFDGGQRKLKESSMEEPATISQEVSKLIAGRGYQRENKMCPEKVN